MPSANMYCASRLELKCLGNTLLYNVCMVYDILEEN